MRLAIQPPEKVIAGIVFSAPIVVTFIASDSDGEKNADLEVLSEISGAWTFLSLVSEDQSESLAPPDMALFQGQRADSVHAVLDPQDDEIQTIGYSKFHDLIITQPGRYCLKVSVIDMNAPLLEHPAEGGRVLPSLHSKPFDVVGAGEEDTREDEAQTRTIAHLRRIGVHL